MTNPLNLESDFKVEELFFSMTDLRGMITAGNSVFVRVSKFGVEELMGKPHNIIRHPDMPRSVFYLLWEELKAGRPISAYVKNMAKDGTYYWVFANVYHIPGAYVSIRLKPTSALLPTVEGLYQKVLEVEKKQGMEAGFKVLVEGVLSLGFPSYQAFMTKAFSTELDSRDRLLKKNQEVETEKKLSEKLHTTLVSGRKMERDFRTISHQLRDAIQYVATIDSASAKLSGFFQELHFMGINLLAAIERLGSGGAALSQIVIGIGDMGNELKVELASVQEKLKEVLKEVGAAEYLIQSCRIQSEMTKAFVEEIIQDERNADEKLEHCARLFDLTGNSIPSVLKSVESFSRVMCSCQNSIETFLQLSSGMEFIRLSSKMESARLPQAGGVAVNHFNDTLGDLINSTRKTLGQMAEGSRNAYGTVNNILRDLERKKTNTKKAAG